MQTVAKLEDHIDFFRRKYFSGFYDGQWVLLDSEPDNQASQWHTKDTKQNFT